MSVEDFDGCSAEVLTRLLADEDLDMATTALLGRACRFYTSPTVSIAMTAGVCLARASFVSQENSSHASAAADLLLRAHPKVEQEKRVHIHMSAKLKEISLARLPTDCLPSGRFWE